MSALKLYRHYEKLAININSHHPHLCCSHAMSIFTATTLNLGDNVVTRRHRDYKNLANGLCAAVFLRNYDHKLGGQLVLHEPQLILKFSPGWIIFLPSAGITHSNLAICNNEWCSSITYYAAGGLFRWAAYGFKGEKKLDTREAKRLKREHEAKWNDGIDLFSKADKLKEDIITLFP